MATDFEDYYGVPPPDRTMTYLVDIESLIRERDEALALLAVYRKALEGAWDIAFELPVEWKNAHDFRIRVINAALAFPAPAALARFEAAERVAETTIAWTDAMAATPDEFARLSDEMDAAVDAWRALKEGTV